MSNIPQFFEYKDVSIEDKEFVDIYLKKSRQEMSECTFANFYLWRDSYKVGLSKIDPALLVRTFYPDGRQSCMVPFGAEDAIGLLKNIFTIISETKDDVKINPMNIELYFVPHLFSVPDTNQENLNIKLEKAGFSVTPDRDNWDYVYLVKDLITLEGTKYHSKKKAMNKCLSENKCEFEEITPILLPECIKFQDEWCKKMNCSEDSSLTAENKATDLALEDFMKLGLIGGIVKIDGKIEAMTIGEELNENTAVIHFEKANPEIDGLYQVINNWFCIEMLNEYEFVNREQDLGKPGIRKAKMSYRPKYMIEKYIAKLK